MKAAARLLMAACLAPVATPAMAQLPITNAFSQASTFDDAFGSGRFVEGVYQIAARQGLTRWFWYDGFVPSAARYELTTTLRGGPDGQGYGIVFGRQSRDVNQWCSFVIDADGHYKLEKWGGDEVYDWTQSPRINTGVGARNTIALEVRGQSVTLFINGSQVNTWYSDRDVSGYIGVEVDEGMEVRFDSYTVMASGVGTPAMASGGKGMPVAATPMSMGSGGASLMWNEDFSTFSVADDEIARSEYTNGGLLVNARQGMSRWLFGRGIVPSNVRISLTAQFRGGPSNVRFGVVFGRPSRDERSWMAFDVTADGQYYLEGYGATNNLGPSASPAVLSGYNAMNQLTVDVRGSLVTLYVNGQLVGSYTASHDASGYIGVTAGQGAQVFFSNLRVERLN